MSGTDEAEGMIVNIDTLTGSLIMGLAVNWGLLGMLCLQVYTYYLAFPKDRFPAKLQVYSVFFFECLQSAIVAHDVVVALTPSLGRSSHHLSTLNSLHTHWFSIPAAGGITGGAGQLFFAYRIWMISGQRGAPFAISFLSIASIGAAFVSASEFFHAQKFSVVLSGDYSFAAVTTWNGISAICDLWIALSMPYFLMRNGTGLKSTHVRIVRLVLLLIETGGLTAIMAILHLCLFVSHIELFVIAGLSISKTYAITMLVIFNNRVKFSGGRFDQEEVEEPSEAEVMETNLQRRNSRTKIFVSNARLTFKLAPDIPSAPAVKHNPSSSVVSGGKVDLEL